MLMDKQSTAIQICVNKHRDHINTILTEYIPINLLLVAHYIAKPFIDFAFVS